MADVACYIYSAFGSAREEGARQSGLSWALSCVQRRDAARPFQATETFFDFAGCSPAKALIKDSVRGLRT